MRFNNIIYPRF